MEAKDARGAWALADGSGGGDVARMCRTLADRGYEIVHEPGEGGCDLIIGASVAAADLAGGRGDTLRPSILIVGLPGVAAAEAALAEGADEVLLAGADEIAFRLAVARLEGWRTMHSRDVDPPAFHHMVNSVPAVIAQIGRDGVFRFVNATLAGWLKRRPDEITGRRLGEIYGDEYPRLEPWVVRALAGETVSFDTTIDYPDGTTRDVRVSYVPWKDGDDRIMGFFAISSDITRARQAEMAAERAHRLLDAIESLSDACALFDADDRLVLCNERYRERYSVIDDLIRPGVRFETIIRAGAERRQIPEAIGATEAWVAARLESHRRPGPELAARRDGTWVLTDEQPTSEGGTVGIRTDVTDRVRAVEELP